MTTTSSNRVAIVSGGARGIGSAVALRLAADGHAVAIVDLDEEAGTPVADEILSAGGKAISVGADVSDEAAVTAAVSHVAAHLGSPTVLINNAGITRDNLLFKMTADDWDAVMNVHLRGSFLLTRAVQSYMIQAGWGRIVTMSSTSGRGNRGQANYAAAKAGLEGFTKTLAIELGKFGVTANAIAPGFIDTPMLSATAERIGLSYDDFLARGVTGIPVGRAGTPDDIAHATSFFVSEGASYVSGQVLYVAGGPK
jgi:3-oxoacyl-[acyl-carrier protein] reductase